MATEISDGILLANLHLNDENAALHARIEALEAALRAFHYYVCASDRELQDDGITREDALRKAYTLHDAALPHP